MFFDIVGEVNDGRNLTNDFLLSFYIWKVNKAGFYSRLNGLEWTTMDKLGTSWEFRGKNLELLVMVFKQLQKYLGTSWE